jgi:hypothetical protein
LLACGDELPHLIIAMTSSRPTNHHTSHHTRFARALLFLVFLFMRSGDVAFWMFAMHPSNPFRAMLGLVVGVALCSTAILVAIWMRNAVARLGLIVFNWLIIALFSMPGLVLANDDRTVRIMEPLMMLGAGLCIYLIVNIILITSHSLHRLGASRGCGG